MHKPFRATAEQIREKAARGLMQREAASEFGVTPQALSRRIRALDPTPPIQWVRPETRRLQTISTEDLKEAIDRLRNRGAVAAEFGISTTSVTRLVRQRGIVVDWSWPDSPVKRQHIAQLAEQALPLMTGEFTQQEVARKLRVGTDRMRMEIEPILGDRVHYRSRRRVSDEHRKAMNREHSRKHRARKRQRNPPMTPRPVEKRRAPNQQPRPERAATHRPDYGVRRVGGFIVPEDK